MKRKILFLLFAGAFVFVGFYNTPTSEYTADRVKEEFLRDYDLLKDQSTQLLETVQETDDIEEWKSQLTKTRLAYKRCEYLLVKLDPMFVGDFFNGAPLPTVDRSAARLVVMEPEGLQVLDELLFTTSPSRAEVLPYVKSLNHNLTSLHRVLKAYPLTDREVFEAMRLEVISIFSLGLTGFDTPGSANAIPEAKSAWQRLTETYAHYTERVVAAAPEVDGELWAALDAGARMLEHDDFDTFDRFTFLRGAADPLYAALYDAHRALRIETIDLTTDIPQHWNYHERQIFGLDLLNAPHFAGVPESEYRPEVIALGEKLFYDTRLSSAGDLSCASCHKPEMGFSDGRIKSLASGGEETLDRNAPGLVHAVFAAEYFYDLRADELVNQAEHVIVTEKEFSTTYAEIFEKLSEDPEYYKEFKAAFPRYKDPVMRYTFSMALASYVASLQGGLSDFDLWARGDANPADEAAIRGFNLFMGKATCGTCHFAPTFAGLVPPHFEDSETEVLGVPADPNAEEWVLDADWGRYTSGKAKDEAPFYQFSFKTMTVRNIERTAPYMHNGSFETLEQVLDFYNNGGGTGHGLEVEYQTLPGDSLGLTETELADLEAFMLSLTEPLIEY